MAERIWLVGQGLRERQSQTRAVRRGRCARARYTYRIGLDGRFVRHCRDSLTLYMTSQNPHVARLVLAAFIGLAPSSR
jgi:hypothetical protein